MRDAFVWSVAAAAIGLAVLGSRLPVWVAAGPPVPVGVLGATCPDCRAIQTLPVVAEGAAGWRVVGRPVLEAPAGRARLFLSADCDGFERRFAEPIPPGGGEIVLDVPDDLRGCTAEVGVLVVDGTIAPGPVSFGPARRSPLRIAVVAAAGLGFVVAGAASGLRLWASLGRWPRVLAVAVGLLIVAGITLPGDRLDALLLSLPGARPEDLEVDPWVRPTIPGLAQKLGGHGLAFALLGFFGASGGAPRGRVLLRCFGFAIATEALQLLIPSRSGRWEDVALDTAAAAVGIAVSSAFPRTSSSAPRAPRGSEASRT